MADFLKDSQLMSAIEELIDHAHEYLWLISPYIKLHDRLKDRLKLKKDQHGLHIIVIFGKNEEDASKSLSKEDFEFFKDFPNVTVGYEKRLHAKFYASDQASIITSMNLHEFSQNNNIEAGIRLKAKNLLQFSAKDAEYDAFAYFEEVVKNSTIIFKKEAITKNGFLSMGSSYSHSEVKTDESEKFYKIKDFEGKRFYQRKPNEHAQAPQGYCIRTGKPIPFDPNKPMCPEAFYSWNQYKNFDFPENYCHRTGKPSNGRTSMRHPIL